MASSTTFPMDGAAPTDSSGQACQNSNEGGSLALPFFIVLAGLCRRYRETFPNLRDACTDVNRVLSDSAELQESTSFLSYETVTQTSD